MPTNIKISLYLEGLLSYHLFEIFFHNIDVQGRSQKFAPGGADIEKDNHRSHKRVEEKRPLSAGSAK